MTSEAGGSSHGLELAFCIKACTKVHFLKSMVVKQMKKLHFKIVFLGAAMI